MSPKTEYRIADSEEDYAAARALMQRENGPQAALVWPTLLAEQNGELVGFIATQPRDDMILAGPMVLKREAGRNRIFIAKRMLDLYRLYLHSRGIQSVVMSVDMSNSVLAKGLNRFFPNLTPYAYKGSEAYYHVNVADITNVRKQEDL